MKNETSIFSVDCPTCKICGSYGTLIYKGLQDRLFSAPGIWNLRQCKNTKCGLIWLDPMPLESDIYKAYETYCTHVESAANKRQTSNLITTQLTTILDNFLRFTPIQRERADLDKMYLGDIKPGRLLEVGCGAGARLARLAALGWSVEGQEVDPLSASFAIKTDIKIHLGYLDQLGLPNNSYDAIIINHVIEHLHEPVKILRECRRLLKPNGILIAVTPNINCLGHRMFKSNWLGLDPPRHIFLYGQDTLREVAHQAGFQNPMTWTVVANENHFSKASLQIIYGKNNPRLIIRALYYLFPTMFLLFTRIFYIFDKNSGEECVLKVKNS